MTILTTPEQCLGIMKHDGFYRAERHGDRYQTPWCCDPFKVEQSIAEVDDKRIWSVDVVFKSPTGDCEFSWTMDSLNHLKTPAILIDTLLRHGMRVSTNPAAAVAILDAIQRPDLITMMGDF